MLQSHIPLSQTTSLLLVVQPTALVVTASNESPHPPKRSLIFSRRKELVGGNTKRICRTVRETLPLFSWNFRRRTLRESSSGVQLSNNPKYLSKSHTDLSIGGFEGNYVNQKTGANDYVRKHNPLVSYDSVTSNTDRLAKIKNFTMFDKDLSSNKLPQWMFITPNMSMSNSTIFQFEWVIEEGKND